MKQLETIQSVLTGKLYSISKSILYIISVYLSIFVILNTLKIA
jgi:hypothetical protein